MVDFAHVDALAAGYHRRGGQPGLAYGIVAGGELVHAAGLGERHLGGPPPDAGTVFRIASMTKSFTASAILTLRDDGLLRLDDLAEEYVPELRDWPPVSPDAARISIRHLLTMTAGFPTDATDNSVQANIVAAGYSGASNGNAAPDGTITGPGGQCVDVIGDDTGIDLANVDLWNCQSGAVDQHWTHNSDNSLSTLGRCLDIDGNGTAVGTKVELYDCNGVGGQKWVQQANGSLLNPQSGLCLDDPSDNTANGTQLQIYTCNGTAAQQFALS